MKVNMHEVWKATRRRLAKEAGQIVESGNPDDLPWLEEKIREIDVILAAFPQSLPPPESESK